MVMNNSGYLQCVIVKILTDILTTIGNSIHGSELFKTPYPVGMSTFLSRPRVLKSYNTWCIRKTAV